jgi:glycine/D-amino acid oxidase-like deaminating enzyme
MSPPDLQILGHGLAGAVLAERAVQMGLTVRVWDDGGPAASRVAAGLFTPLTGQHLATGWALDRALPHVNSLYSELDDLLGINCYFPLPTCRIFQSAEQRDECGVTGNHDYASEMDVSGLPLHAPWGAVRVSGGGWVNVGRLLDALLARRRARGEWAAPDGRARITVWAEGGRASVNPLWRDVGWCNAHGDVLTLHIPGLPEDQIYSFGKFLLPLGHARFRCGATYVRDVDSHAPSDAGRDALVSDVGDVLTLPFEIEAHHAGIRPVTVSRMPIAGPHPEQNSQWIFNGFGSKGVLYVPWMADCLLQGLMNEVPLPKEVWAPRRIQRQRDRDATARLR